MKNFFDSGLKNLCAVALVMLSFFLFIQSISAISEINLKQKYAIITNVITVRGSSKIIANPDVATFTFTVRKESKDPIKAQQEMSVTTNQAIAALKAKNVAEKNIKMQSYNTNPKYSYPNVVCVKNVCPPSNPVVSGYEASQVVNVKVLDITKIGELLNEISALGISEVGEVFFAVDEPQKVKILAREEAINNAKKDAKLLAKNLGVKLGKIVRFNEDNIAQFQVEPRMMMAKTASAMESEIPQILSGETPISSNVSITYEIK